jgi:tetratricopeptide (TPR) repeat protein
MRIALRMTLACVTTCTLIGCTSPLPEQSAEARPLPQSLVPQPTRMRDAHATAVKAFGEEDAERAEELYLEAVRTFSQYPAVWNNLGVLLMEQDRYNEAAEAFARAAELAPDDPRPVYNEGLLYFNRRYPHRALPLFEKALQRDPNHLDALRASIQTQVLIREVDEGTLELIARAMMLDPDERWRRFYEENRSKIETLLENP